MGTVYGRTGGAINFGFGDLEEVSGVGVRNGWDFVRVFITHADGDPGIGQVPDSVTATHSEQSDEFSSEIIWS